MSAYDCLSYLRACMLRLSLSIVFACLKLNPQQVMTLLDFENSAMLSLSIGITVLYCTALYHCTQLSLILHALSWYCTVLSLMLQELREIVTAAIGTKFSARWGEQMVEMVSGLLLLCFSSISPSARIPLIVSRFMSCNFLSCPVLSCLLHFSSCRAPPTESIFLSNALAFASLHLLSEQSNLTWHHLT